MSRPIAVLLSDVHYSVQTLEKAANATLQAQSKALGLGVPLLICGDLHDSKAQMRAEVVNRMIEIFGDGSAPETHILIGNHCMVNERGGGHALNFLREWSNIIDRPYIGQLANETVLFIPYQSDLSAMREVLDTAETNFIIMHQGLTGTDSGEYYQDPTAIPADWLAGRRVISGHYHTRQTIPLPDNGQFDYVGNPFTLNFGEAKDPEKGYQILNEDLTLTFVPTNLPTHLTCSLLMGSVESMIPIGKAPRRAPALGDILRITVSGPSDELIKLTKAKVQELVGFDNIVLDLEPYDTAQTTSVKETSSQEETFDSIIDNTQEENDRKARLKALWRTFA